MSNDGRAAGPIRAGLIALVALAGVGPGAGAKPLSAIDWLSRSVELPAKPVRPPVRPGLAQPVGIAVTELGSTGLDALGLLRPAVTGLPVGLWSASTTDDLIARLKATPDQLLPALQDLLYTLLLAEADPPSDSGAAGRFFLARVDRLLDFGALDQAQGMLEQSGTGQPSLFRRWFDVELLLGQTQQACRAMQRAPEVAPTLPARIFCLGRLGDWSAAAITLTSARALGVLTPTYEAVLTRFLDTAGDETAKRLDPPDRPSPLIWRMMEAIGEPLPTTTLPPAFAQADLSGRAGWKAQVTAAERLARLGAIQANQLIGIYTEGRPSASGEPWDRVAAVQALDAALRKRDRAGVEKTLPAAWQAMSQAGLGVPFAAFYASALTQMRLPGSAGALAFRIGLLSPDAAVVADNRKPQSAEEAFLIGLAHGNVTGQSAPDATGGAIAAGFAPGANPGPELDALLAQGKSGEAILSALARISQGREGDLGGISAGLALLRKTGLDQYARRAALQLMLLPRRAN